MVKLRTGTDLSLDYIRSIATHHGRTPVYDNVTTAISVPKSPPVGLGHKGRSIKLGLESRYPRCDWNGKRRKHRRRRQRGGSSAALPRQRRGVAECRPSPPFLAWLLAAQASEACGDLVGWLWRETRGGAEYSLGNADMQTPILIG